MHKTFSETDLLDLIAKWMKRANVYAPVRRGDFLEFQPLDDPAGANLNNDANTRYPPKSLFLPQSEVMFRVDGGQFDSPDSGAERRVIVGIRPCDARAIQLLDEVFITDKYTDPYWAGRRESTTIVALGCEHPCESCFCSTVGSGPFDGRGADVLLTHNQEGYVAESLSAKGDDLIEDLPDASRAQVKVAKETQAAAVASLEKAFETKGLDEVLYGLFDTGFWQDVQQSCLGCGVCTFLCPTCHCFDIVDEAIRSERVRNWDTCMFRLYSLEASGHNPRPTNKERTRQRVMHKYAYFMELYNEIGCTGCGRCVRYCPVNLDIRHIIRSAQSWKD